MSENGLKEKLKILGGKDLEPETIKKLANITNITNEDNDKEITEVLGYYFKLKVLQIWDTKEDMRKELGDDEDNLYELRIPDWFGRRYNVREDIVKKIKEWDKNKELKFFIKTITQWFGNKKGGKLYEESIEKFGGKISFAEWYLGQERKCCYCGIEEKDLKFYFNISNMQYWRNKDDHARQRGKYLEIERIKTDGIKENPYSPTNTRLACYICNNAKSDFLSAKSFKPIAKGINEFWRNCLGKDIKFPEKSKVWEIDSENNFAYKVEKKTITITGYKGETKDVVIPRAIDALPVVAIGVKAFEDKKLTNVVIPDSVKTIGVAAFKNNLLTNIVIPGSVNAIREFAFADNELSSIVIPNSVDTIGAYAFYKNKLTDVIIPDSVKTMGVDVFAGNQITNLVIPDSVKISNGKNVKIIKLE